MRYKCGRCHTEYFAPGECNWCPNERLTVVLEGSCEVQLERANLHARRLEIKAARWDKMILVAHRMGGAVRHAVEQVISMVRER